MLFQFAVECNAISGDEHLWFLLEQLYLLVAVLGFMMGATEWKISEMLAMLLPLLPMLYHSYS